MRFLLLNSALHFAQAFSGETYIVFAAAKAVFAVEAVISVTVNKLRFQFGKCGVRTHAVHGVVIIAAVVEAAAAAAAITSVSRCGR